MDWTARGTIGYRSPELITESPTFTSKSDIWALGCILYELVTGWPLFENEIAVLELTTSGDHRCRRMDAIDQYFSHFNRIPDADRNWFIGRLKLTINVTPDERPSASELKNICDVILRSL
jgi:serine/threonine protein kinase